MSKMKKISLMVSSLLLITTFISGCALNETEKNKPCISKSEVNKVNNLEKAISVDSFLEKNHSNIDLTKDNYIDDFKLLDEDAKKYDVFFAGEAHAIKKNYYAQLALLKYFKEKAGVKYLLSEIGYSSSAFINEYLETGKEEILKESYRELKSTAAWSRESYEFWKKLRKYNMTLTKDNRIKVIGVDIEHQWGRALDYLYYIMPNGNVPKRIKLTIQKIKNSKNNINNLNDTKKLIKIVKNDINYNENSYKEYLGSKFFDFSMVVDNINNTINANEQNDESKYGEIREKSIYNNFKRIYMHFPKGKYFGQWGAEHVYQRCCNSYLGDIERFAMHLNKIDSPVQNKVLSIVYGYEKCFRMTWGSTYGEDYAEPSIDNIDIVNKYAKTDITLFKLTGDSSPFKDKLYFVEYTTTGVTTDYFQYIMLIKDSKGTLPLQK